MGSVASVRPSLLRLLTAPSRVAVMPASKGSRGSSKKAKKTGSNVFDMFTQAQVAEFKDGFAIMDRDRDGILNKSDIRGVFDEIGRLASEDELDAMLSETPDPINFTTFLSMFAAKSTGENDEDEVVIKAFKAFEKSNGEIDSENFRTMLMAFGDKFTELEVSQTFEAFDDYLDEDTGMLDTAGVIAMIVGKEDA